MAAWVTVAGGLFVEDGIHSRPDEQGEASLVAAGAGPAFGAPDGVFDGEQAGDGLVIDFRDVEQGADLSGRGVGRVIQRLGQSVWAQSCADEAADF